MTEADRPIVDDPREYGAKGEEWHPAFVAYMKAIVTHPAYSGMPDAVKPDGKIQWEAPSNRRSGAYQFTHQKRRDWWRTKALSIGIDPERAEWISRTAKRVHPTGEKPCKRCGRVMRIAYAYPSAVLVRRILSLFGDGFDVDPLEEIGSLVQRLADVYGEWDTTARLGPMLGAREVLPPDDLRDKLEAWLAWIEDEYIPREPRTLSPGAMSNAPDRLDGFHSFNLCCRHEADTGRHASNLRAYVTDRRVFEYWSDGDWIAADRLMGLIRARFQDHPTADGGERPSTADHIGPLSLGFMHRPQFRLLSHAANSARNNRMSLSDVRHLLVAEVRSPVTSWYAQALWNARKESVRDDETALRMSKLLRDNQRNAMVLLGALLRARRLAFLGSLLNLGYADWNVEFEGLRINGEFLTEFDRIIRTARATKYAQEQKARRLRVGFDALRSYSDRQNRHLLLFVGDGQVERSYEAALKCLADQPRGVSELDAQLDRLLLGEESPSHEDLRCVADLIPDSNAPFFCEARAALEEAMSLVAARISAMWDSDRYVRAEFDFEAR